MNLTIPSREVWHTTYWQNCGTQHPLWRKWLPQKNMSFKIEIRCHLWIPTDPNNIQISSSRQVLLFFVNVEPITYSTCNPGYKQFEQIVCIQHMLFTSNALFALHLPTLHVWLRILKWAHKSDSIDQNRCISHSSKSFPRSYSTRCCWRCSNGIRLPLNFGCSGVLAMPSLRLWNTVSSVDRIF